MGLIDKFKSLFVREDRGFFSIGNTDFTPASSSFTGNATFTNFVNQAYKLNPVAYGCMSTIMEASSKVLFNILRDGELVDPIPANLQPLEGLLKRPHPDQAMPEWIKEWVAYMLLDGNAFAHITGVGADEMGNGELRTRTKPRLTLLRPDRVKIENNGVEITGFVHTAADGKATSLKPDEVIWWRLIDPANKWRGTPPTLPAWQQIQTHNNAVLWNRNTLANGGVPAMIIAVKGVLALGIKKIQEVQREFAKHFLGAKNQGKPIVVAAEGLDVKQFSASAQDLEWLSGKEDSFRDICRAYRVATQLLFDPASSTYANYQEARKALYNDNILPLMLHFISETAAKVIPLMRQAGIELELETGHIESLQDDIDAKTDRMVKSDWMTTDEKRAQFGLDPVQGGDTLFVPFNLVPLDQASTPTDPNPDRSLIGLEYRYDKPLDYVHPGSLYPTEGDRLRQVVNIVRARARFIELYTEIMVKYFRDQGKRTVATLKDLLSTRQDQPDIINTIFVNNGEEELLAAELKEIQFILVSEFGADALAQLKKAGVIFDINRPGLDAFLANDLSDRSRLINESTARIMQGVMNQGLADGEGAQKLADRITDAVTNYTGHRSLRVARTEVNRASTLATEEGYRQGGVAKKEWISARDASVRDTHVDLDGQAVFMNENFTSPSGASGPGPGLLGDPAEDINCRCTIAPIVESEL